MDEKRLVAAARNAVEEKGEQQEKRDFSGHVAGWGSDK